MDASNSTIDVGRTSRWVSTARVTSGIGASFALVGVGLATVVPIAVGFFGDPPGDTATSWCGTLLWRTDEPLCDYWDAYDKRLSLSVGITGLGICVYLGAIVMRWIVQRLDPSGVRAVDLARARSRLDQLCFERDALSAQGQKLRRRASESAPGEQRAAQLAEQDARSASKLEAQRIRVERRVGKASRELARLETLGVAPAR